MSDVEQIFLSDEVLGLMRHAADVAGALKEPFITVRALLLALLDDETIGPALAPVLPREKLEAYVPPAETVKQLLATRVAEPNMPAGEKPSILRFNTLAFKTPDGAKSVWLSPEALKMWNEGARRVDDGDSYKPKHLAFGIAADAIRSPGLLTKLNIAPGDVNEAILNLDKPPAESDTPPVSP